MDSSIGSLDSFEELCERENRRYDYLTSEEEHLTSEEDEEETSRETNTPEPEPDRVADLGVAMAFEYASFTQTSFSSDDQEVEQELLTDEVREALAAIRRV